MSSGPLHYSRKIDADRYREMLGMGFRVTRSWPYRSQGREVDEIVFEMRDADGLPIDGSSKVRYLDLSQFARLSAEELMPFLQSDSAGVRKCAMLALGGADE